MKLVTGDDLADLAPGADVSQVLKQGFGLLPIDENRLICERVKKRGQLIKVIVLLGFLVDGFLSALRFFGVLF